MITGILLYVEGWELEDPVTSTPVDTSNSIKSLCPPWKEAFSILNSFSLLTPKPASSEVKIQNIYHLPQSAAVPYHYQQQ